MHESAPAFEAVAIDEMVNRFDVTSTATFASHNGIRSDREPIKRRRQRQAECVAALVSMRLPHLLSSGDAEGKLALTHRILEEADRLHISVANEPISVADIYEGTGL